MLVGFHRFRDDAAVLVPVVPFDFDPFSYESSIGIAADLFVVDVLDRSNVFGRNLDTRYAIQIDPVLGSVTRKLDEQPFLPAFRLDFRVGMMLLDDAIVIMLVVMVR